jgi:hypothetical protein
MLAVDLSDFGGGLSAAIVHAWWNADIRKVIVGVDGGTSTLTCPVLPRRSPAPSQKLTAWARGALTPKPSAKRRSP